MFPRCYNRASGQRSWRRTFLKLGDGSSDLPLPFFGFGFTSSIDVDRSASYFLVQQDYLKLAARAESDRSISRWSPTWYVPLGYFDTYAHIASCTFHTVL